MKDLDEMRLARVVDACDGISGRVKMQKIVYLLTMMGYDLPFDDFTIRQHGPFSRGVACAADTLKAAGIIEEKKEDLDPNDAGEPVIQFSYSVRKELIPLVRKHFDIDVPADKPPLEQIAGELKLKGRKVLEVVATRVFLEREGRFEGDALEGELKRIKGHLAKCFSDANDVLEGLRKRSLI